MKQFSKDLGNVSLVPKGKWSREQEYEKLALVYNACDNLSYVAKINVPSGVDIENREYWQPMNATGYADNNFINLTTENENGTITAYESLEEAVATILPINRRAGATLSFFNLNTDRLDRQAEFELWQFNSTDLANWEIRDYWNNIYYNWNVFAGWYVGADSLENHVKIPNVGQYAYVGTNINDALLYQCRTNGTWTNTGIKVRNYISVVVSGNITIGENGNWFNDGNDTGIPATPAVDEQLDNIIVQLQQHTTEISNLKKSDANLQNQITSNNSYIATLNTKHESLSKTVQGIAATGGASTATNVTYNNDASGLNAENAQDAIDELQGSKIDKTSILQESGEAEDKVMSQKAVSTKLSDLALTKDAISPLFTKTETKKKESGQEITFFWTHLFFKKDTRLQLVVENPNGNVSELIQTSVYSVKEDGLLSSGYTKIVEEFKAITDNKFIVDIIYPADGYLMLNWGGQSIIDNDTLTAKYTLYGSLSQEVSNLNTKVEDLENNPKVVTKKLDNIQKAISVLHNVNRLDVLSPINDNMYINVVGDSIMAFQSTSELPEEGVTNVPPTCDKMANCYYLWKAISWGNCEYARFDKGKKSLVGKWDNTISDDTNAFFIESGTFKTEYIGTAMREKFPQIDVVQVSTIIDAKSFPYQFDESENSWWQRNIPKRFSNEANASVSFTIPKGYKYFDLLYHANIHGDNNVSISVQNSKTVKICNNYEKDFAEKESISSYTLDTSYTPTRDHDDRFGIPNQRLHFKIDDISSSTTIKITKSSDTSKYFIYWGVSFWGTNANPYCLQINNMAIGGYGTNSVDAIRESLFKGTYCDGVILEVCANTVCSKSNVLDNIKTYFNNYKMCFNKTSPFTINLDTVGVWIPHLWNQNFESSDLKAVSYINNKGACKVVRDLGYNLLFNVQNIFDSVRLLYSPDMSEKDFINQYDPGNGVHLRNNGYKLYYPAWQVSSGKL